MKTLWLAAHFPMLGFEVHTCTAAPDDARKAAVLIEANRVVQADPLARAAGIEVGMTLATAHSIATGLDHFVRDEAAEQERLARLGLIGYRFSSQVSIAPPAGLLIEASGSLRLFDNLAAFVEQLASRLRQQGHETRIAAADTPLAALLLARSGLRGLPSEAQMALRRVPLANADFSPRTLERLENMGFHSFEALLRLPPAELAQRFEPAVVECLARLVGRKADPRAFIEPPEQFRSAVHLLESVSEKDALLFPMRRLATELARWLAARSFGTELLIWEFQTLHGASARLAVRFADPTRNSAAFLALSKLRLERAELPLEVMSIVLRADLTTPYAPPDTDLFTRRNGSSASCAELVDQLIARLGTEAVRVLAICDDHRPECACTSMPLDGNRRRSERVGSISANRRPLWLLDTPKPVAVQHFELLAGPERIETGWWADGQFRDYFVAISKTGAQCWLFCNRGDRDESHANNQWFLHGYFA